MRSNKTQEEVINEFRRVHGDFYNYDKVVYIGTNKKVIITCPVHGDFPQAPAGHKRGEKCPDCSYEKRSSVKIEKTKTTIIELIHYSEKYPKINYSDYLGEQLDYNYNHLSSLFSEITGTTIGNYIIINKIERVKELLLYDELTLTEISLLMEYSSVAHLSHQFKKITGLTPTYFKKIKQYKKRIMLEEL